MCSNPTDELDTGQIKATAKVAESLFRKATTDGHPQSVTAAIFWLKTRGGWRETAQSHPLAVTDLRQLSDADLERIIGTLQTGHLGRVRRARTIAGEAQPAVTAPWLLSSRHVAAIGLFASNGRSP